MLDGGLGPCVLHRDVKAANVVLIEGFEATIWDFGLAQQITHNKAVMTMTTTQTMGYVALDLLITNKATKKAYMYSFGVLALDMACKRPTQRTYLPPTEIGPQCIIYYILMC